MLALRPPRLLPIALALTLGLGAAPAHAEETRSRWLAALPFGAGQFQNGDIGLGIFLLAGETLLGTTSIVTAVLANSLASTPISARSPTGQPVDVSALNSDIRTTVIVNRAAFVGWAALTAAGVIEAEVSFGPRRPAPKDDVKVTAAPLPGGALLGLRGRF